MHNNSVRESRLSHFHFPFYYKGRRYFAEVEKAKKDRSFRIKQIIPQIKEVKPSSLSFDLASIPTHVNANSEILTLKILDGLRDVLGKLGFGNWLKHPSI